MKIVYIYGLFDPRTDELRYIGKTVNPKRRHGQHVYDAKHLKKRSYVSNWTRKLLQEGITPKLVVLEKTTKKHWQQAEKMWIKACRKRGYKLTNIAEGGATPKVTETTKKKLTTKALGRKHSEKTKQKIGLLKRGNKYRLGKLHSEETKLKISKKKKGRKSTKEHVENAVRGRMGYKHSEETKKKIGLSNSEALKGHKHSEETKRKISEAGKKFYENPENRHKASVAASNRKSRKK